MKQILFTAPNTAALCDVAMPSPAPFEVLVKTAFSTVSAGTEKANLSGDKHVNIDPTRECPFPRASGYSSSGIVVAVGDGVTGVQAGDRVTMSWSLHREYNCLHESLVTRIPDAVSLEEAALYHIATFPLAAIRKCETEIGEPALVVGLGVLGLFAVSLLRAAGAAPIVAVDLSEARRRKALSMGADYALDPRDKDFADKAKSVTNGGAKVCIEVTGVGAGLNSALDCMARFGRVALLGCTRDKSFEVDYYRKVHGPGVRLIGAHTLARPEQESSHGMFTLKDDVMSLVRLSAGGRLTLADAVDEVCSPMEAAKTYERLLRDPAFPPIVQFDWSRL